MLQRISLTIIQLFNDENDVSRSHNEIRRTIVGFYAWYTCDSLKQDTCRLWVNENARGEELENENETESSVTN